MREYAPSCPVIPVISAVLFKFAPLVPVVQHVAERTRKGDASGPSGIRLDLAYVGDRAALLMGAHARGIGDDLRGHAGERKQLVQNVGQARLAAGTHVVDLARAPVVEERKISRNDVANVGHVARDVEIPRDDTGRREPLRILAICLANEGTANRVS